MTIEVCDYFTGSGGVPPKQADVGGTRDITADTDSPCAASFASPRRLQDAFDTLEAKRRTMARVDKIKPSERRRSAAELRFPTETG